MDGFANVLIAAGNSGNRELIPLIGEAFAMLSRWCAAWLSGPCQSLQPLTNYSLWQRSIFQTRQIKRWWLNGRSHALVHE